MKTPFLFLLAFYLLPLAMLAQDDIETDRPDQTETSAIVPKGRVQIETGLEHKQTGDGSRDLNVPEILWKYGINDKLELRMFTTFVNNKVQDSTASGLEPITLGLKTRLWEEKGILPETSLLLHLQIPKLASKKLKFTYAAPEMELLCSNTISHDITLGYNIGLMWDGETPEPEFEYTFSPCFTLSEKFKGFVEAFGFLPQHDKADNWVDAGLLFLITKDIQIDVSGGYELTAHNHYHGYYETLGLSFRI